MELFLEYRRQTRGLLAVIRAIVRQMATTERSSEDFAALLEGRLGALARVHEILLRAPDVAPDLTELVHAEFLAQAVAEGSITLDGPPVMLCHRVAASLALALHELTMNAIQFGALSHESGHVTVQWKSVAREELVKLQWRESCATSPPAFEKAGFGWELLRQTLPYELGARVALQLQPDGLECLIEFQPQGSRRDER